MHYLEVQDYAQAIPKIGRERELDFVFYQNQTFDPYLAGLMFCTLIFRDETSLSRVAELLDKKAITNGRVRVNVSTQYPKLWAIASPDSLADVLVLLE